MSEQKIETAGRNVYYKIAKKIYAAIILCWNAKGRKQCISKYYMEFRGITLQSRKSHTNTYMLVYCIQVQYV